MLGCASHLSVVTSHVAYSLISECVGHAPHAVDCDVTSCQSLDLVQNCELRVCLVEKAFASVGLPYHCLVQLASRAYTAVE